MAAPFNYQIFNNVTDRETFLNNIRNVASNNGWTIDKDDITNNLELYLHSTGNGNQNLYFSMKIVTAHNSNIQYIVMCGNTGFDTGQTYNNQPGKWYETNHSEYNGYEYGYYYYIPDIGFPITKQYILANSQLILVFFDIDTSSFYNPYLYKHRLILSFGMGAIDTYKGSSDTEGNYMFLYGDNRDNEHYHNNLGSLWSAILGTYHSDNDNASSGGLLYKGGNKHNDDLGLSVRQILYMDWDSIRNYNNSDSGYGIKGYQYNYAVQFNDWASRTSLIKPIVSIKDTTSTDVYFYPIGELPYYACKAYPYYKAGDIITQGTRNFMVFPILYYTNGDGVAVEVNV